MNTFLDLHKRGTFVLINVHDAGTATIAQSSGAVALGTTSAGHAHSLARRDGRGNLTKRDALQRAEEICAAVTIPVSIDAENGWGHSPEAVQSTISDLANIGAAGASIEDWSGDPARGMYERSLAIERIHAAVDAAESLPEPFVICARAESILYQEADDPLSDAIERLQHFAAAGADCVYAPGPQDVATFARIVTEVDAPVNANINLGSQLTVAEAERIGVRRISLGGSLFRASMTAYEQFVKQLIERGTFTSSPLISSATLEAAFDR